MKKLSAFKGLYAVIDSIVHQDYGLERLLQQIVLESQIPVVQFRWKKIDGNRKSELITLAGQLKAKRDFVLIINDDSEFLERAEVDGLHLGQKDIPLEMLRKVHPDKILGLSTHNLDQAQNGDKRADYIGCGAVYPTHSKSSSEVIGPGLLREMVQAVSIPTVAIGGINADNIFEVAKSDCSMVAVIAALIADGTFQGQRLHEAFLKAVS